MDPSARYAMREAMHRQKFAPCPRERAHARLWLAQDQQRWAGHVLTSPSACPSYAAARMQAYEAQRMAGQAIEDALLVLRAGSK